ncbi:MAG: PPC domain-containing protein, partial [Amphiplicatus sp.]
MSESTNYLLGRMDAQDLMLGKTDDDASNFSALSKNGYGYFAPVLSAHFGALANAPAQAEAVVPDRASASEWLGKPETADVGDIVICACGFCGPEASSNLKDHPSFSPSANLSGVAYAGGLAGAPSELLVDGNIGGGEIDAYSVNLVAGETYFFSVYGSGANPLGDTFLYVIDNTLSVLLDYDDDGGAGVNSVITYTATYTGLHYIGVGAYPGSGLTGDYTLDLFEFPDEDFVSDTFEDAPVLPANGVTYGFIDGGPEGPYAGYSEVDTYAIQVEAGKIYSIEVAGGADYESDYLNLRPGELDTILQLFDSEGNFVAGNDDISFPGDISSRISFLATESGTYYLDVLAYLNLTSDEFQAGGYTITTQEIDPADLDPVDALIWESAANVQFDETNTAYVYFAAPGESFGETADDGVSPLPSFGWSAYEIQQVMLALEEYEKILGVNYEITNDVNQA